MKSDSGPAPMQFLLSIFGYTPRAEGPQQAIRNAFEVTEQATRLGFDGLATGHHFLSAQHHLLQPLPLLARLAAETDPGFRMTLTQILSLAQPVRLAEEISTLAVINGGGITLLGVLGYAQHEFDNFGIDRRTRARRFEECCDALRSLWEQDHVTRRGTFHSLHDATINPKPISSVDIWVGADGSAGIRRAAKVGNAWAMASHLTRNELAAKRELYLCLRAAYPDAPRQTAQPLSRITYVARTDEEAIETMRPFLEERWRIYNGLDQAKEMDDPADFARPYDALRHGRFLIGSPQYVADEIRRYREELNIDHLTFIVLLPGLDPALRHRSIELLSREVLPIVREDLASL